MKATQLSDYQLNIYVEVLVFASWLVMTLSHGGEAVLPIKETVFDYHYIMTIKV